MRISLLGKWVAILLVSFVFVASLAVLIELNPALFDPSMSVAVQIYAPTIPASDEKVVCIVFDDGWKSQLDAIPILERYNYTATFAIVTSYASYPAYLSWDDVAAVAQKGNDIVSHTHTHPRLSTLDNDTLHFELSESRRILRSKGYPADVLVYPYGDGNNNTTVHDAVSKYYLLARGTETGKHNLTSPDRFTINSYGIYRDTTLTDFANYLNGTQGTSITLLYYHKISPEEVDTAITAETFQMQMQYLHDHNFTVRTISQIFLKPLPK